MSISVRLANVEDTARMAEVHVAAWQGAYAGVMTDEFLDGLNVERFAANWATNIANPDDGVTNLVGELDGLVQGICTVGPFRDHTEDADPSGELWLINLHPQAQGSGLAKPLHDQGLDLLRSEGHHRAALWVAAANPRARRFYEREGWTLDPDRKEDNFGDRVVMEARYSISL